MNIPFLHRGFLKELKQVWKHNFWWAPKIAWEPRLLYVVAWFDKRKLPPGWPEDCGPREVSVFVWTKRPRRLRDLPPSAGPGKHRVLTFHDGSRAYIKTVLKASLAEEIWPYVIDEATGKITNPTFQEAVVKAVKEQGIFGEKTRPPNTLVDKDGKFKCS